MAQFTRTKKLTSYVYSPTDPASEDAIRLQVDNSIQEVADILYSQDAGKGASQVGINGLAYATVQDLAQVVSDSGTGTAPPADSVGNAQLATDVKVGSLATLLTTIKTSIVGAINELYTTINALNSVKYYGKWSQSSGGSAVVATGVQTTTAFVSFSTETNDDFNAIDIAGNPTRITIPSGVTKVQFSMFAKLECVEDGGDSSVTLNLFKNNVLLVEFGYLTSKYAPGTDTLTIGNRVMYKTNPIVCASGDYFEIQAISVSGTAGSASLLAGSTFMLEVLG